MQSHVLVAGVATCLFVGDVVRSKRVDHLLQVLAFSLAQQRLGHGSNVRRNQI